MANVMCKRRRNQAGSGGCRFGTTALLLAVGCCVASWAAARPACAQQGVQHRLYRGDMPPGAIGRRQLQRGGPLRGYFQPVRITGPAGCLISAAVDGKFAPSRPAPVDTALLVGRVYRFRVTGIPRQEGLEVYPTIEVIDRLYPPRGEKARFPIPVQLTAEELALALGGKYVTRVIYLEDPHAALPFPEDMKQQRYYEVMPDRDPLEVADRLGRPVAILRMGSRIPGPDGPDDAFLFGCPPLVQYPKAELSRR